jgi:tetratricopeptide (TPR) repeat protein
MPSATPCSRGDHDELCPASGGGCTEPRRAIAARPETAGGSIAAHWAELSHHWSLAHEDERAFEAALRAGEAAERAYAFEAALRDYERALELWPGVGEAERIAGGDRAEMLARAAHAAYLAGVQHRAVALQREAVAGVDPETDPVRGAALRGKLGRLLWIAGDAAGALTACQAALAMMPPSRPRRPVPRCCRATAGC